jgi:hypothetical protein
VQNSKHTLGLLTFYEGLDQVGDGKIQDFDLMIEVAPIQIVF